MDLGGGGLGVDDGLVLGQPAQPAAEGPVVAVDGDDVVVRGADEGALGEDEAEVRAQARDEGAALHLEDGGVDAAAVEAEDAREVEGGVRAGAGRGRCAWHCWGARDRGLLVCVCEGVEVFVDGVPGGAETGRGGGEESGWGAWV